MILRTKGRTGLFEHENINSMVNGLHVSSNGRQRLDFSLQKAVVLNNVQLLQKVEEMLGFGASIFECLDFVRNHSPLIFQG